MNSASIEAAFGMNPNRTLQGSLSGLPADAVQAWHRAVALGALGYYAGARGELARVRRFVEQPAGVRSLSWSTEGSLWRQLGWYERAARCDGAALACAETGESIADATTGLAADALGAGRLALSHRLLGQVVSAGWRQEIRLHWVSAEWAMASGLGDQALRHANDAVLLSDKAESVRHRVKSALLRAAALTCVDARDEAMVAAAAVHAACVEYGFVPLCWATSMLRGELAEAATYAGVIAHRGGYFRSVS